MELRQEQKLKQTLSQNMLQSTEILQMGQLELKEYLEDLALENPVVDIEDGYETPDKAADLVRKMEWLDSIDERNRILLSSGIWR